MTKRDRRIDLTNKIMNVVFWVLAIAFIIFLLIATTIRG